MAGDVVLKVNGKWCSEFVQLEEELDSNVGKHVSISLERGGQPVDVELPVESSHPVACPTHFLQVSKAIFHSLSLTHARNHNKVPLCPCVLVCIVLVAVANVSDREQPPGGVYLATSGFMLGNVSTAHRPHVHVMRPG